MSKRAAFLSTLRRAAEDTKNKQSNKPMTRMGRDPNHAQHKKQLKSAALQTVEATTSSKNVTLESPCPAHNESFDAESYRSFCASLSKPQDTTLSNNGPVRDEILVQSHVASSPVHSPVARDLPRTSNNCSNERRDEVRRSLFGGEPASTASAPDIMPLDLSGSELLFDPHYLLDSLPEELVNNIPLTEATLSMSDPRPSMSTDVNHSPGIPSSTEEEHLSTLVRTPEAEAISRPGSTSGTSEGQSSSGSSWKRQWTPPEKMTRKRLVNKSKWKKNVAKMKLASGEEHVSTSGVLRRGRSMQPPCDLSCRLKCFNKVSETERKEIFDEFWKIKSQKEKWDFVALHVELKKTPTKDMDDTPMKDSTNEQETEKKQKKVSRIYNFRIHGQKVQVCKTMFLETLDICDSLVQTTFKKLKQGGYISPDKRQGHARKNKPNLDSMKNTVKEHIKSIPRMSSHYSRAQSSKEYLVQEFQSCADMHEEYLVWMAKEHKNEKTASLRQYREVFNTEFNISFFIPKKDGCDNCTAWENTPEDQRPAIEAKYKEHQKNKDLVTGMKDADVIVSRLKDSKELVVAHFDYEKNLICPKANSSVFYYRRKLCVSNFTIVDVGRYEDVCYVYDETIGHKGSNEVASFLLHFITGKVEAGVKEFRFYSDNCGGQNKNRNVAALYAYAAARFNIKISHKFLEKGHTYNKADKVHSDIERKTRPLEIFTPQQWYNHIGAAKRSKLNPIKVIQVNQSMIFDWSEMSKKLNLDKDKNNTHIPWRSVRQLEADSTNIHQLKFKTNFDMEAKVVCTKTVGRPVNFSTYELKNAYNGPHAISKLKLKDLLYYCDNNLVPLECQEFYRGLKSDDNICEPETIESDEEIERGRPRKRTQAMPKKAKKKTAAQSNENDSDFD